MENSHNVESPALTESNASAHDAGESRRQSDWQSDASRTSETEPTSQGLKRRRARDKYAANLDELRRRVYEFAELSEYTWRERLNIRLADWFFYLLIRILCLTV